MAQWGQFAGSPLFVWLVSFVVNPLRLRQSRLVFSGVSWTTLCWLRPLLWIGRIVKFPHPPAEFAEFADHPGLPVVCDLGKSE